jgi:hypothetical protein
VSIESVNVERNYFPQQPNNQLSAKAVYSDASIAASARSNAGDKLEISTAARNLNQLKNKVASGFYDSEEVINETAEKINSALGQSPVSKAE